MNPMNLLFGDQTSGESPRVRNLRKIDSSKYNKDFVNNLAGLNSATDYMAQYLVVMQKGIDEANKNIIQKIQDFIADLIIIFTGGSDTGFEFGDLGYIVQALGALFGFQGLSGPVNLLEAALHFFTNFLNPLDAFGEALDSPIIFVLDMLANLLEMIPFVGSTLSELVENIADGLNLTHNNTQTISTGVTGNVTGSTATPEPGYVGTAIAILNSALSGSTSAPQVDIYNAGATWTKPAGCINMDIHVISASGNAAAGGTYFGGNASAGGGGGGGGYSKSLALAASSVTATVAITVGTTAGASSSFGSYVSSTGGGNGNTNGTVGTNGTGNQSVNVSGGKGGGWSGGGTNPAVAGNAGPYSSGGAAGVNSGTGGAGGAGISPPAGSYGPGSGGGGGGAGITGNGGPGGAGGFPGGGPGGGGGSGTAFSSGGGAGAFKAGQVVVISYF